MKKHDFSLRQLQYVVAVADTKSFRLAAKRCDVSQPSLRAQVEKVEAALKVQLFERDRRRVLITEGGSELIECMRNVLVDADDISIAARRFLEPLAGTLRIGVIPTIGPYLLPTVAAKLRQELPLLTLAWLEEKTETLVRQIRHGSLDGAFLALESDIGDVTYETITEDPFVLAAPPSHPLGSSSTPVPLSSLEGERLLLLDEGHCLRDQVIEFCSGVDVDELGFRSTSLPTLVQMASANMGITLLPLIAVPAETHRSDLVTRPIQRPTPHRTIILAWRRQSALSVAMQKISQTARLAVQGQLATEQPAVS